MCYIPACGDCYHGKPTFHEAGPPPRSEARPQEWRMWPFNTQPVFTTGVWSYEANVQQLMLGAPLEIAMSVAAWHCVAQLKPKEGWLNPIESPNPVKTLQCQTWLAGKSPNSTLRWKKLGRSSNGPMVDVRSQAMSDWRRVNGETLARFMVVEITFDW